MFADFNFQQMISAFIVLFAVIDIIGSIPIIINLKEKGKDVNALKATVISFILMKNGESGWFILIQTAISVLLPMRRLSAIS